MSGARRWGLRIGQLALVVAIGVLVYRSLAADLRDVSLADLGRWRPDPLLLLASLLLLLSVYLAHALLWRRILSDLRIARLSLRSTLRIYFVSSLGRYLPGKLWQLAGLAALAAREGIAAAPAAAASIVGQLGFLTTGLILLAAVLPTGDVGAPAIIAAILLVAAASTVWVLLATNAGHGFRSWVVRRFGERIGPRLGSAFALAERIRLRDAGLWTAGYAASWVALGIAFTLFTTAFVPAAGEHARELAATVAASYLAGYLSFMPGGIGVRELTMAAMLSELANVPGAAAVLVAAASRVWFTVAELLPIALIPVMPATRGSTREETA